MRRNTSYEHSARRRNNPTGEMATTSHPERRTPARHRSDVREKDRNRIPTLDWNRQRETKTVLAPLLSTVEKVDPVAWIETLRRQPEQGDMFASFDRYESPELAKWEWYEHSGDWQNRLIHATAKRAMASLLEHEQMAGEVQCIYFDPPYGMDFDARYMDDTVQVTAFRDSYEGGIHTYLDGIRDIALLARELLSETGSFFMQIGDVNVHRCAMVLDEVFGPENRVSTITYATGGGGSSTKSISKAGDYILWCAKNLDSMYFQTLYEEQDIETWCDTQTFAGGGVDLPDGTSRPLRAGGATRPETQSPGRRSAVEDGPVAQPGPFKGGAGRAVHVPRRDLRSEGARSGPLESRPQGARASRPLATALVQRRRGHNECWREPAPSEDLPQRDARPATDKSLGEDNRPQRQALRRADRRSRHRALHADDHPAGGPDARPDRRRRHDGSCRGALGPTLDQHRQLAREHRRHARASSRARLPEAHADRIGRGICRRAAPTRGGRADAACAKARRGARPGDRIRCGPSALCERRDARLRRATRQAPETGDHISRGPHRAAAEGAHMQPVHCRNRADGSLPVAPPPPPPPATDDDDVVMRSSQARRDVSWQERIIQMLDDNGVRSDSGQLWVLEGVESIVDEQSDTRKPGAPSHTGTLIDRQSGKKAPAVIGIWPEDAKVDVTAIQSNVRKVLARSRGEVLVAVGAEFADGTEPGGKGHRWAR